MAPRGLLQVGRTAEMVDQARPTEAIRVLLTGPRLWLNEDCDSDDRQDNSKSCVVNSGLAFSDFRICILLLSPNTVFIVLDSEISVAAKR